MKRFTSSQAPSAPTPALAYDCKFLPQPHCLRYLDLCAGGAEQTPEAQNILPPPPQGHAGALPALPAQHSGRDNLSFFSAVSHAPAFLFSTHPLSGKQQELALPHISL